MALARLAILCAATALAACAPPPLKPVPPGAPGGLADDRSPLAEGNTDPRSAQGAAQVVQHYFALIEARRYRDAFRLWSAGGRSSRMTEDEFAASFNAYREYHAQIGAPGPLEGAAGTIYVRVPVQVYGRLANGRPFTRLVAVVLGRVNDVPGATAEQLRWRIYEIAG